MNQRPYSIRFPFVKVRTGSRRGPRYRLTVDKTGLQGARLCAAGMINGAMLYRDEATRVIPIEQAVHRRIARLGMRVDALWARVFAAQIDQHDPRLDAASEERHCLVDQLCHRHPAVA